ncbi:hypothetical protein GF362_06785 [Candidatus Dojkabacteria bacterium]|nr:hypothetical protein [Candidatus Dojkabacteria bacterium]
MAYKHSKFTGYNSIVEIIQENGSKYVLKTIRIPMELSVVQDLEQRILLQRSALESMGISIPELIKTETIHKEDDYNLLIKEKFEGVDFVDVVDENNFEFYIDKVLDDIYKPLLKSTKEKYLKAGIDPIARNFVYKTHVNHFCYVDFIPPKVFYKGHYSQEIPEIEGPFYDIRMLCHNERAGLIYVQYVNFIRVFPQKRKFIQGKIEQFLENIEESELKEYIINSPLYRIENPRDAAKIVKEMDDWRGINYYYLREAICIASELNSKFRKKQSEMFKLTTHERDPDSPEYGLLPQERFLDVKQKVIKAFEDVK